MTGGAARIVGHREARIRKERQQEFNDPVIEMRSFKVQETGLHREKQLGERELLREG